MTTLALPDELARAAAQQVAMERKATAILDSLTFGIFCHMASQIIFARQEPGDELARRQDLEWAADQSREAAIVMAERFGFHFSRRPPEPAT